MFGTTINVCGSVLVILTTAVLSILFIWFFCVIMKKCIEVFKK